MLLLGLIPTIIIISIFIWRTSQQKPKGFIGLVLILIIFAGYYSYFNTYGMIYTQSRSNTLIEAKEPGKYVTDLSVYGQLKTQAAWCERKYKINHLGLIKLREPTDELIYVIQLDTNQSKQALGKYFSIYDNGSYRYVNAEITFDANENQKSFELLIRDSDDIRTVIDTVKIKRP